MRQGDGSSGLNAFIADGVPPETGICLEQKAYLQLRISHLVKDTQGED